MGAAAAICRPKAPLAEEAAGSAEAAAEVAPETPRRASEAGGQLTRSQAAEVLRAAERGLREAGAEQANRVGRLWTGLREELVARGVLRDCRQPVPLGPGAERACMQVRVALAARDAEQVQEALAYWDSFGLAHVVEAPRLLLEELRRGEEAEVLYRCLGSALAASDRVGFDFWCQEAAAQNIYLPEDEEALLQVLRLQERAMVAERVKKSRHRDSLQLALEVQYQDPVTQLDLQAVKAELARRNVNFQGVADKEELLQMLRSSRESKGNGGVSARGGRGPRGEAPRAPPGARAWAGAGAREGLAPQSFKAYASEREQADNRLPPSARPRSAAARCPSAGPPEGARRAFRSNTAPESGPAEAVPQSARQRRPSAGGDVASAVAHAAAAAGAEVWRPSAMPELQAPRCIARPQSAAPRIEADSAPRPSSRAASKEHAGGGSRSASKEPYAGNGAVSYRANAPRPGTPRATPRGMAGNAANVLDPRCAARAASPQTPRSPRGSPPACSPPPTTPRSAAAGGRQASTPPPRPPRLAPLWQGHSPPGPSRPPSSWQSPPRPASQAQSPRPSPTKPPQMPRRPQAGDKVGLSRAQALFCLGLVGNPTAEELRRAYKEAALRWHPDRQQNHGNVEEAKERFQEVQAAFEYLKPACPAAVAGG